MSNSMRAVLKISLLVFGTFTVVFGIHLVGAFVAWSLAPGNVVPHPGAKYGVIQTNAWPIFAFPLFYILPEGSTTIEFEPLLVLNSLCVAFVVALIALIAYVRSVKPFAKTSLSSPGR